MQASDPFLECPPDLIPYSPCSAYRMSVHTGAVLFLLALAALLPSSLGYTTGARAESCYGHEIEHINPENPPAFKQDCIGNCCFDS